MIDVLSQATHNFVQHQLRLSSEESSLQNQEPLFHANISLTTPSDTTQVDFYYSNDFIQMVCMAMLGEEAEDDETIHDLVGETTNLIAGSAKTLADNAFDIGLPTYVGKESKQPNNGTYRAFSIDDKLMLFIKVT